MLKHIYETGIILLAVVGLAGLVGFTAGIAHTLLLVH